MGTPLGSALSTAVASFFNCADTTIDEIRIARATERIRTIYFYQIPALPLTESINLTGS
jgi:hypothetical protein